MFTLLGLLGCPALAPDTGVLDPAPADPVLTEITVSCERSLGKWNLDAKTDAWTGGGTLWLSVDGTYVEEHPVYSFEAALDGSTDHLKLSLTLAADLRDVSEGSSTAFNCGTPDLQGLFVVRDRPGTSVTDCRVFGSQPALWTTWAIGECSTTIAVEAR